MTFTYLSQLLVDERGQGGQIPGAPELDPFTWANFKEFECGVARYVMLRAQRAVGCAVDFGDFYVAVFFVEHFGELLPGGG